MYIDSYYIDDDNIMHTFIGKLTHVTISDVVSDEQAEELIGELNDELQEVIDD